MNYSITINGLQSFVCALVRARACVHMCMRRTSIYIFYSCDYWMRFS